MAWFPWLAAQSTTQLHYPIQDNYLRKSDRLKAQGWKSCWFERLTGQEVPQDMGSGLLLLATLYSQLWRQCNVSWRSRPEYRWVWRVKPSTSSAFASSPLLTRQAKSRQGALSNEWTDRAVSDSVGCKTNRRRERRERERRKETGKMRSSVYGTVACWDCSP